VESLARRIGSSLRELRAKEGLSQQELALACGMAPSYYSALERGQKNPTIDTLKRVADALHVSVAELVASDDIKLGQELENVLRDVPSKVRPVYLRAMRDVVLVLHEASAEAARRGLVRAGDVKVFPPSS
jgi:transcriptional regulator with XRE-family HTH domain